MGVEHNPITVTGPGSQTVQCQTGETLLDAWLRQAVNARFSCKGGSCHTCMLRCTQGALPARSQIGIAPSLTQKGYFLPCLCVPLRDMQVAQVNPEDFLTECRVESVESSGENLLLKLEPLTVYGAEPGQYTCVTSLANDPVRTPVWISPWRIVNRQEEDFYLHLQFDNLAEWPVDSPEPIKFFKAGDFVRLRPVRDQMLWQPEGQKFDHAEDMEAVEGEALWKELGNGTVVRAVLEDFYREVFTDSILEPYFRNVTMDRLIGKQYAFLHDEMTGGHSYFGDNMRNTHHWMVIPESVFNHRQVLLRNAMESHQLSTQQIRAWMSLEERHRGDIVKTEPFAREFAGQALPVEGYEEEVLSCGALCDHCGRVLEPGEKVRYHVRLGHISCSECTGTAS